MKKYKKLIIVLLVLIFVYAVDFTLVSYNKRPIFVIQGAMVKDGGTRQYYGVGYKVIGWHALTFKQIDGRKTEGILTGYEISIFPFFQDINKGPKKELKFVPQN